MQNHLKKLKPLLKTKFQSANPMTKRMTVMLLLLAGLFGFIIIFKSVKAYMMMKFMFSQEQVVTVSAMHVNYESWLPQMKATGSLRAIRGVDVTTEIAGLVRTIDFTPGADVKQGTLLVQLNTSADVAQLHALQATAELANVVYTRDKAQYAIHAVSKATLDNDAADLKNKNAQVDQQAATIAKKILRAPFDGHLGICAVNPGQYVNPGDKVVTLQALNPLYVDFYLPQQALVQLKISQPITLTTDTYPGQMFTGIITTIDPKVDPATRNVAVEATIDNPKHQLLPGMFGTVEIITGAPKRYLTLPQTAVSYNSYGDIVFIVKQTDKNKQGKPILTVTQSFVIVGPTRGDQVAILSGLKQGDRVVTAGQLKLRNGTHVAINNTVVPSNNPNPHPVNE